MSRRSIATDLSVHDLLVWLKTRGSISQVEARERLGIWNLEFRIQILKDRGHLIQTVWHRSLEGGGRRAVYHLKGATATVDSLGDVPA